MTTVSADSDLWIRRYHPRKDARVELVCFPHAGGSATFYLPVSEALKSAVAVSAIQYPGRQDRRMEKSFESIDELVDAIVRALRPRITTRPLAFLGHSMGAMIAYEVARRLEHEDGVVLAALFASGRRAPSTHRDEALHQQSDTDVIAELRKLNGTDQTLLDDDELVRMILPAVRSDYRAIEKYVYRPGLSLSCPMHVFVGDQDPRTTLDEAAAWRRHTSGEFNLRVFPGGHFYLVEVAADVIEAVSDALLPYTR